MGKAGTNRNPGQNPNNFLRSGLGSGIKASLNFQVVPKRRERWPEFHIAWYGGVWRAPKGAINEFVFSRP